ncbi:15-hydroxyprostaglandin dehydrogenase [NAD(+)]-like [Ptiloglossa arizonensis]|uniref:15-hydroxyprostaglandin dehydrogenase [NAD(+)]-like n=1 Tax=Ptiloglossa arizonensis TaxID=3350558 RepID=UPI003FA14D99
MPSISRSQTGVLPVNKHAKFHRKAATLSARCADSLAPGSRSETHIERGETTVNPRPGNRTVNGTGTAALSLDHPVRETIMSIEGKVSLVTGGANGIGFCTARKLLRNGAKAVALLDLADSGGESAAADLNEEFGKDHAIFVPCDVSKNELLKEAFKKVIDTYGTLDIVVNIAGIMDDADWEIMVDVNYKGIVHGTILGLQCMGKYKGGNGGTIVNMSSVAGLEGIPIAPIYGGTQYAIVGFTQSLKHYYEKTGIRMLTICPGLTTTAMAARFMSTKEHAMDLLDEEMAALAMTNMQKQPPEHVASAIIQLIEKEENGTIYVSENNQAPYAVEIPSYTALKATA